jgi:hypothetical protein
MNRTALSLAALLALGMLTAPLMSQAQISVVPNSMNFQGRLATPSGNSVPDGTYSIRFSLWSALTSGTERYNKTVTNVQVKNGVFAVTLDAFPAGTFNGNLWLEIKIGTAAALTPRQPLVSVPYAFKAGSVADNSVTSASIANGTLNIADFPANFFNTTAWLLGGNSATNPATQFIGTTDNQPLMLKSNNRRVMHFADVVDAGNTLHAVNVLGGVAVNSIASGVVGATIAGGGMDSNSGSDSINDIRGNFGFIGGGSGNFIDAFTDAVISGGSGNIVQGSYSVVAGGRGNNIQSGDSTIGGGNGNYVFGTAATIGGGSNNSVNANLAAIAGGDFNAAQGAASAIGGGQSNSADGFYGTIGGGFQNVNNAQYGAIGGGAQNEVSGFLATIAGGSQNDALGQYAAVGGGSRNVANADTATVAGGDQNTVNGTFTTISGGRLNYGWSVSDFSTIGGGFSNTVYGDYATIPGGYNNDADGLASFAGGYRAYAAHDGSFVWADAHEADFISTAANQFCIRATGGIVCEAFGNVAFYSGVGTGESNRYFMLLNSPNAPSASGLKAGGILCADSFAYANPGKNNMAVKGTLGVGYPDPAPYVAAFNGNTYSSGSYLSSDVRYKKNIVPLDNALDSILTLRGVSYEWDKAKFPQQNFGDGKQMGMIAQEVEKVFPHLVMTAPDGYKAVNYVGIVPILVEAVKTQQKQIDAKDAQIGELESKLDAVLKRLDALEANRK